MLRYLPLFTLGLWLAIPAAPVGAESEAESIAVPTGGLDPATDAYATRSPAGHTLMLPASC